MHRLLPYLALLALTACGGGDSNTGGASGVPPAPFSSTGMGVTFSSSSLTFAFTEGSTPQGQAISASASGATDKDLAIGAEVTGSAIATPLYVSVDAVARTARIGVLPRSGLAAGTYTGTIKLLACTTQACTSHHAGSPHTVDYSVTVRPGMKLSASSLSLAAAETAVSNAGIVTITSPGPNATLTTKIAYKGSQNGWLTAQIVDNTLRVQASAVSLVSGTYTADVALNDAASGQTVIIPVTLKVGAGWTAASDGTVRIDSVTTADQLQGSIPISLAPGVGATRWSASSDQSWLRLNQASGTFPNHPTWTLDSTPVRSFANSTQHTAKVTISTDGNLPAKVFTLNVNMALAQMKGLDALARKR